MTVIPFTEIQSLSCSAQFGRLRKIVRRIASTSLKNPEAIADLEQAFDEVLDNALKQGDNNEKISLLVSNHHKHEISVEMTYPGAKRRKPSSKLPAGFQHLFLTQSSDSVEYTFNSGRTIIRITKKIQV
ncbi:MAG: ATP-binding protein [Armatimonadota bacterium]